MVCSREQIPNHVINSGKSAEANKPTLIVPDKDADGLSSGVIVHRLLVKLGLDPKLLDVHLVHKGTNIHEEDERKIMLEKKPQFVIVLDQGSRKGPPVVDDGQVRSIVIDHHLSDDFPEGATVRASFLFEKSPLLMWSRLCLDAIVRQ